jgi:hypothetical protein
LYGKLLLFIDKSNTFFGMSEGVVTIKNKTIYTHEISMIAETQTVMNNFTHGNSI